MLNIAVHLGEIHEIHVWNTLIYFLAIKILSIVRSETFSFSQYIIWKPLVVHIYVLRYLNINYMLHAFSSFEIINQPLLLTVRWRYDIDSWQTHSLTYYLYMLGFTTSEVQWPRRSEHTEGYKFDSLIQFSEKKIVGSGYFP